MADEQDQTGQDEELLLTEEAAPEGEEPQGGEPEDEFAIELEGDEPAEEATPLVRDLRQQLRAAQKEAAEYRKANQPKVEVGEKPDLWEDCDGDVEKYDAAVEAWKQRKRQAEEQDREAERAAEVRNQEYQRRFTNYRAKAAALPVNDFDDAEKTVIGALPELLQSAVVAYAEDPAKVVYALAKHPSRLAKLAEETDPIKFVLAMRDMERNLKVVNKRKPPTPEADTIQSGSAQAAGSDKVLEKLEKEADRTGDRTKVVAYKREQRRAKAA